MVDLSPPHLPRHHKAGPANHSRTVADEVNIDFPQQGGNVLLGEGGNALVFGRLHDKLRFQGGAQWRGNLPKCFGRAPSLKFPTSPTALHVGEQVQATKTESSRNKL